MKKFVFYAIIFAFFIAPIFVNAQKDLKGENSILILEETVVTAGRVEEKKEDVTINITVVTEKHIQICI